MSVISSVNSDQGSGFFLITKMEFTKPKSTGTFIRFIAKKFKPTANCCHICRYNFKLGDDLKVHRSKILLRMSALSESAFLQALSINCKLATLNDESSDLIVSIKPIVLSLEITDVCLGWKLLPVSDFPMIFEVATGEAEQEINCTSWFNKIEVKRVIFYLDELLNVGVNGIKFTENDIGVISPYKKQVSLIEDACRRKGWRDIMIS